MTMAIVNYYGRSDVLSVVFLVCPKDPAVLKTLCTLLVVIHYRGDPCANAIFLGFTGILPLKEGLSA